MARQALTDNLWGQLQATMKAYGCYQTKNSREVMEAILWKLRTGAPWRDIPKELCPWKTAYNRFNCNGQVKSDTRIEITVFFCSRLAKQCFSGDKYPNFECNRT